MGTIKGQNNSWYWKHKEMCNIYSYHNKKKSMTATFRMNKFLTYRQQSLC